MSSTGSRRSRSIERSSKRHRRYSSSSSSYTPTRKHHKRSKRDYSSGRRHGRNYSRSSSQETLSRGELSSIVRSLANTVNSTVTSSMVKGNGHQYRGDAIPEFDPEVGDHDIERWIRKVDDSRDIYSWSEETTIYYALNKLKGLALTWYNGLMSRKNTWEEWKVKLRRQFPFKKDYRSRLEEMLRRRKKPDETMQRYYVDITGMLNACEIYGSRAVSCIIGGISDEHIRTAARAAAYATPEQLFDFLQTCNTEAQRSNYDRSFPKKSQSFRRPEQYSKQREHGRYHKPSDHNKPPLRCFNCGEVGHKRPFCPRFTRTSNAIVGGRSEKSALALNTNQGAALKIDTTSLAKGNEKYFNEAKVNGVGVRAYVDFGSQCTILRHDFAKDLKLKVDEKSKIVMKGFGSGRVSTLGSTTCLISVGDVAIEVRAEVVPDDFLDVPLIIGQPLTESPDVVIIATTYVS